MRTATPLGEHAIVLGAGRSGEAAARLLAADGIAVVLLDSARTPSTLACAGQLADEGIQVCLGEEAENFSCRADFGVVSPGIDPRSAIFRQWQRRGIPLIGELELGARFAKRPLIAITGTNGKTTTTELTQALCEAGGLRTVMCGNIGRPLCDAVRCEGDVEAFVVEVSSFQLESIETFHPCVAVWLNFSPDHLDRHSGIEAYFQAKLRIFENQTEEDEAVVNQASKLPALAARVTRFGAFKQGADITISEGWLMAFGERVVEVGHTQLKGLHNVENMMAAIGAAARFGVPLASARGVLESFTPSAHRCEVVAEINGVLFVNDSKSTNVDSLHKALLAMDRPVILIAGGKDKGFRFDQVRQTVAERVTMAVLLGETREHMRQAWSATRSFFAQDMQQAVELAFRHAEPGSVVLLSPGTSSFDMFRDYAERGDAFRRVVQTLKTQQTI